MGKEEYFLGQSRTFKNLEVNFRSQISTKKKLEIFLDQNNINGEK